LSMVYCFWNFKQFFSPPFGASKYVKNHSNLTVIEQDMPFQSEGGWALVFS
jgi:hypothetical protein